MKYVAALVAALVLNAMANLLMKTGIQPVASAGGMWKEGFLGAVAAVATSATLLIGLVCFALNVFLYLYALQSPQLKISLAYPIMVGGGYALIAVIAGLHPSLQERLNTGQWFGVALVFLGIVAIALPGSAR